jgi:hypothetical protein
MESFTLGPTPKSISIELSNLNFLSNIRESCEKHLCIELSILSPNYLMLENLSKFNPHNSYAIQ